MYIDLVLQIKPLKPLKRKLNTSMTVLESAD